MIYGLYAAKAHVEKTHVVPSGLYQEATLLPGEHSMHACVYTHTHSVGHGDAVPARGSSQRRETPEAPLHFCWQLYLC